MRYFIVILLLYARPVLCQMERVADARIDEREERSISYFSLKCSCIIFPKETNNGYRIDSMLLAFYERIEFTRSIPYPVSDTDAYFAELLSRAKSGQETVCLLPILRLFDERADEVYNYTCRTVPYSLNHGVYGLEPQMQLVVLFAIHFSYLEPLRLKKKEAFNEVKLVSEKRIDEEGDYEPLLDEDYQRICDLYIKWLRNKNSRVGQPLDGSGYKWVVEIGKRDLKELPRKQTFFRRARNFFKYGFHK